MRLGIDFGTCNSSAAFFDGNELVAIKEPTSLNYLVPSCIFVASSGKISVGKQADNQRRSNFARYRSELKRYLGENTPMRFGETTLTPSDAIAEILKKIKKDTDNYMLQTGRAPLEKVVLTIPATYQAHRRKLMQQVAQKAGFAAQALELLAEPVAAGLYYAHQKKVQEGEILLVYDLGGGTFDTALLEKRGDTFTFYHDEALPRGIDPCGGVDFDQMIYSDLVARHPEIQALLQSNPDDELALLAQANIGDACTALKHSLSDEEEAEITIPLAAAPWVLHHRLTRAAFNGMIAGTIRRTIDCCREMVRGAHLPSSRINHILLVGGSCRIPYVREQLTQEFHCPISMADDLELVVCKGAALYQEQNPLPSPLPPASPISPLEPKKPVPGKRERGDIRVLGWDAIKKKEC